MLIKKNQLINGDEVVIVGRENHGKTGIFHYKQNGVAFVQLYGEELRPFLLRNVQKSDRQLETDRYAKDLYLIKMLNLIFNF
jgi:hypothetical protein